MKKKKTLLVSWIMTLAYLVYIVYYMSTYSAGDSNEQVGAAIAFALMLPHLFLTFLALVFNVLGWALNKRGFALTGAILYSVAMFLFLPYFFFIVTQTVLSYVGFAKMPKKTAPAAV
jgi:hypothetical protein